MLDGVFPGSFYFSVGHLLLFDGCGISFVHVFALLKVLLKMLWCVCVWMVSDVKKYKLNVM